MANEQTTMSASVTTSTPDLPTAVLSMKVDNIKQAVDEVANDVKKLLEASARQDERIKDLEANGKWAGGIISALLIYVLTRVGIHLPG